MYERLYFFRNGISPNDLLWVEFDPVTGQYRRSGDFYATVSLEVVESLGNPVDDAGWLADGSLVTLRETAAGDTMQERLDRDLRVLRILDYPGAPLRVLDVGGRLVVVSSIDGRPALHDYVVSDDGDGDGVANARDAFPIDPAASIDRDGDGAPETWNPGAGPGESTTRLVLDLFPDDRACWLASHELGGQCDFRWVIAPTRTRACATMTGRRRPRPRASSSERRPPTSSPSATAGSCRRTPSATASRS